MATVLYGGSPRHHNRIMVTSTGNVPTVVPNFHKQMLPASIPPPPIHSYASASYHHQCHGPNQIGGHHQQYATFTSTSIISQTKIYAPPKLYSVPGPQPKLHKQLPLTPPQQQQLQLQQQQQQQQHQQQLPPQLPQKMRQRHHPSNASVGSIPMESAAARFIKRKTAVELLAESKSYYVKSEVVLDRKQQLNQLRGGGRSTDAKLSPTNDSSKMPYVGSPSHTFPHRRIDSTQPNRRSVVANSELLQTKLRRLLNDPKEQYHHHHQQQQQQQPQQQHTNTPSSSDDNNKNDEHFYQRPNNDFDNHTPTRRKTLPKYLSPQRINQELSIHSISDQNSDNLMMYPSAFLSPQSLPPQHFLSDDDLPSYDYCDNDDSLILTTELQPISPPAEYAEGSTNSPSADYQGNRQNYYQRSNSHSQTIDGADAEYMAIARKSHKSLPDLHAQTSRHSPHSDAMSYRSRGNRSNKSGSSMNRDSGGSSGHYTHRSEPYAKQQQQSLHPSQCPDELQTQKLTIDYRRDSGSSTQHSNNSYRQDCIECNSKNQCGDNCLLNFTTSEVPEAFKDDYIVDHSRSLPYSPNRRPRPIGCEEIFALTNNVIGPLQIDSNSTEIDLSPPLGTFRRQKCLRIKQHPTRNSASSERTADDDDQPYDDRKPILRSKSDISHRYWHRNIDQIDSTGNPNVSAVAVVGGGGGVCIGSNDINSPNNLANSKKLSKSENLLQLERFFDHLGLNDDKYDEYIAPRRNSNADSDHSSPIYFSDVSTVDSTRLLDSTETQATIQPYRPIETTSIVERNARIIKWLCTCRKLQMT